ncbi:hypothetical protein HO173_011284 [Letharia columbiana]|uniref:Uncharacterized protein n=1 Tax=Letharia columbiana TaxID=112416 RepID=A0A8H6KZC7_9LECA|nr:uncharacterized protein HO173_011284 [Letharia columbiana]KAF6229768.1 hypothetical protein HO173_011284 [Letharia columbiana]
MSTRSSATSFNGTNAHSTPMSRMTSTQPPASRTTSVSSMPPKLIDFYQAGVSIPPAILTNNSAGDVIVTLSHDFANNIADLLSLVTCPVYDPRPSEPIIEKRQTFARNPCAVARSKSAIKSISGGTSLFRALFHLPRAFPTLVSPLEADVQDISSYVKLNLPSWSLAPEPAIDATAELFYFLTLKHEMDIGGSIIVNTILLEAVCFRSLQ